MRGLAGALGAILALAVLWDAFETIVLPRRVTRLVRITALFFRYTWRPWSAIARRIRRPRMREAVLGYYGPLSMLMLLGVWAVGLVIAFAILFWGFGPQMHAPEQHPGFWTDLYMSGTTFFTLGLGDVTPRAPAGRFLAVLEGGLGFGFLALVISYLPVLNGAFSRREVNISLMDSRAGSPSVAAEFLQRYSRKNDRLQDQLHELERWTADLLESHISYPVLTYFRSQHDNQSWLGAVTTTLDACALVISGAREDAVWQAELTFAMARHTVVDIAQILKQRPRPFDPDRLPPGDLQALRRRLPDVDIDERILGELRALYEPYVNALSTYLVMRVPRWYLERRPVHNWETSKWDRMSSRSPVAAPDPVEDDH